MAQKTVRPAKLTKIVATVSDLRCQVETLRQLWMTGVDVIRLNTAHQTEADTLLVVENARAVGPIPLMLDTKGPEVRTALLTAEKVIDVKTGDKVFVCPSEAILNEYKAKGQNAFTTNYARFTDEVGMNNRVLIDDGLLGMHVVAKDEARRVLELVVENDGVIKGRKSVNTPDVKLQLESVTERDKTFLRFAAKHDLEFVAHSFVRCRKDIEDVRAILSENGSHAQIIAKIENREGIDNIDEILDVADGIMVARGDLGIEVPFEEVPMMQKMLIRKCNERAKPVITATQMLHTMMENPRPTRAEVSDIANAILDGTDAIMLSGETASGKYPFESVETMVKIAMRIESERAKNKELCTRTLCKSINTPRAVLCSAAMSAIQTLPVKALVCDTLTGRSARIIATYKAPVPVYAQCHDSRISRMLALSYGVYSRYVPLPNSTDALIVESLTALSEPATVGKDDLIVFVAGTPGNQKGSNIIEINTVDLILQGHSAHCVKAEERI
eukprot:m51a1_g1635 pyruvate kinase, putative (501) ;mRNA; r:298607-300354